MQKILGDPDTVLFLDLDPVDIRPDPKPWVWGAKRRGRCKKGDRKKEKEVQKGARKKMEEMKGGGKMAEKWTGGRQKGGVEGEVGGLGRYKFNLKI